MRALILTAAVLIAGSTLLGQATAADHSYSSPEATLTFVGHGYSPYGHHGYGYSPYGRHGYSRHHSPYYGHHYPHGCHPPVIIRPPVVVPYPYPYGYPRGYSYYRGGVSVNTGRVGFSIAF